MGSPSGAAGRGGDSSSPNQPGSISLSQDASSDVKRSSSVKVEEPAAHYASPASSSQPSSSSSSASSSVPVSMSKNTTSAPENSSSTTLPPPSTAPTVPITNSNPKLPTQLPPLTRPPQSSTAPRKTSSPDYFSHKASLSLEPNPFEQSFGNAPVETPGGTKLPSVAALTSPSSLLPGGSPFWGQGSLRTGPLSPAMLSGPANNDYFGDPHPIPRGFPTPNESSLRTGLTPGGSGSMFPAPSPTSQSLFSLSGPAATPGTLDFHRTALNAAAAKREQSQTQQPPTLPPPQPSNTAPTSQPQEMSNGLSAPKPAEPRPAPPTASTFDPHDNDAANGLFMLAQGRSATQLPPPQPYNVPSIQLHTTSAAPAPAQQPTTSTSPQVGGAPSVSGSSGRGASEASARSEESEGARPSTRAKGKRTSSSTATNARRKAEEPAAKAPAAKKTKTNSENGAEEEAQNNDANANNEEGAKENKPSTSSSNASSSKAKMTDEEKRRNFLERNRVAALKCRQRKKQWLQSLQQKVEMFSSENDQLTQQITQLREEVVNLKTLLLAHKDCPVTQQQGLHGAFLQQALEPFNHQPPPAAAPAGALNPYATIPPSIPPPSQPVLAGQSVSRRYS